TLHLGVRFQGAETLPDTGRVCPGRDDVGRGPMDVGYVHADFTLGTATSLDANARIDERGRFAANLESNQPVTGNVQTKIEKAAIGQKRAEDPAPFPDDSALCVAVDLPFEVQFPATKDARIAIDKTVWALRVPASDPSQFMHLRFGELHQGTWLPGA